MGRHFYMETFPIYFLMVVFFIAVIFDIRFHRIPNWLTFSTLGVAVIYHAWTNGLEGLLFSFTGLLVGIGVLIIPYLMGGMGAGDIKLMGAIGGVLGPQKVFVAFLCSAIIGGFYALVLLALSGQIEGTLRRYGATLKAFLLTHKFIYVNPPPHRNDPKLCYGAAIAVGTIISIAFFY
jgi:prepilin peptidase CpaA